MMMRTFFALCCGVFPFSAQAFPIEIQTQFEQISALLSSYMANYGSYPIVATPTSLERIGVGWGLPQGSRYRYRIVSAPDGYVVMACGLTDGTNLVDCHRLNGKGLACSPFDAASRRSARLVSLPRQPPQECPQTSRGRTSIAPVLIAASDISPQGTWVFPWVPMQTEAAQGLTSTFLWMEAYQANYNSFPTIVVPTEPSQTNLGMGPVYNGRYTIKFVSNFNGWSAMACSKAPLANGKFDCRRVNTKAQFCSPFDAFSNTSAVLDPTGINGCPQSHDGATPLLPSLISPADFLE